jgi:hypothetical protein
VPPVLDEHDEALRVRDEEIERLRAVIAGDPSPRMIRTEDVARVLWPLVYAGRRDACHDEGFSPRFDELPQRAQDIFCASIDDAMQLMGATVKRDAAEEEQRASSAAQMFDEFTARGAGLRSAHAEIERLRTDLASVTTERDRLQRACNEGLPRERIDCPACRKRHVEGPRHDNPSIDGRTRPHHTHRCYHCGHVWPTDRWSFGVAEGEETAVAPSEIERLRTDLATLRAELDAVQFSRSAARQDAEYLARAVGRVAYELVFENSKGTRQAATAYVLADGRAYAPILGPSVRLFATLEELGRELATAFGDGFRLTSTEKTTR